MAYHQKQTAHFRMHFQPRRGNHPHSMGTHGTRHNHIAPFPTSHASQAASYVNLATPGTNNAAPGTAPGFDTSYGWAFTAASSQYLLVGSGSLVATVPLTMAVLFQSPNVTSTYAMMCIKTAASPNDGWQIFCAGAATGDPIRANSVDDGTAKTVDSTASYTADTWYTAITGFEATNKRYAYLNGTNKGTNTDSSSPDVTTGKTAIGCTFNTNTVPVSPFGGKIAACAFYNTNLSDAQVLALHNAMAALVA